MFKMPFLISTSPDTVQLTLFIYPKLERQQKALVVLQNHIAVSRGLFVVALTDLLHRCSQTGATSMGCSTASFNNL